ncbi:type IV pilus assembly protein PilW [Steroidobacter denitrificans]|uniref:Type IV pilus assembly protein PilW n=1 Tax=Steroidobacter denitrificans TaxID=465721 RepID=A0A127FA19_STEDE|nr:PilW family protein [Steroidobacter denitrificans]AMN47266.1 type IV pilus assembly protein PilW [Steroidobacter denitrificans]
MQQIRRPRYQRELGFGLIEIMIGMLLGLLIMGGVLSMFTSSRKTYESTDQLSRVQENGRYALNQIVHDLRSAGYIGCARGVVNASTTLNEAHILWNMAVPVQGFDWMSTGNWAPALGTDIDAVTPNRLNESDILVVRAPRRGALPVRLTSSMATATDDLAVTTVSPAPLSAGDVAMIADCEGRAFFQVASYDSGLITREAGGTWLNSTVDLSYPFRENAEIIPFDTTIYFIADSNFGTGPALWRRVSSTSAAEELAEGVQRIEVRFGEDTNGDRRVDRYSIANDVSSWEDVISVNIALLVRSTNEYGTDVDARTYDMLGTPVGPFNDRRMRELFVTTVTLRNKAL